jgi:serine beta-lactamase-like protein LACTB, mitochondrial
MDQPISESERLIFMPIKQRIITPILLLFVAIQTFAQAPNLSAEKRSKIETAISAAMSQAGIPGLSVAIVAEGKLAWSNGYGLADVENFVPAKASTVYRLASISKPITAVAVMQLVERGKLDLDAPVQKYCAAFSTKQWPVTTRQLLGHLGGVRHYKDGELDNENTRHFTRLNDTLSFFKDDPLSHEPGTKYLYSTYGYNLLGCVVEGASGQNYLEYVRQNIFAPAGMLTIRDDDPAAIIPNRAQGYEKTRDGALRNSALADVSYKIPGGGFCSTVEDLAKFAIALQSNQLLKPATRAQAWTKQNTKEGQETTYGLGWQLSEHNSAKEVAHGGNQSQVTTYLYMQPERNFAVVLMMNLEGVASRTQLARQIAEIVLQ